MLLYNCSVDEGERVYGTLQILKLSYEQIVIQIGQ